MIRALLPLALVFACSDVHADLPKPAQDITVKPGETRTLVLAGGCFWCTEGAFEQLKGVLDVTSGYSGGKSSDADYETVSAGRTGHAESVRITYDSSISFGTLLQVFFTVHDPTTLDRQGNDAGHQYRSAIFFGNDEEKKVAEAYIKQLEAAKIFPDPIVTKLERFEAFYPAEAYHQDYNARHPDDRYVRYVGLPKQKKVRDKFPQLVKAEPGAPPAVPASGPSR